MESTPSKQRATTCSFASQEDLQVQEDSVQEVEGLVSEEASDTDLNAALRTASVLGYLNEFPSGKRPACCNV